MKTIFTTLAMLFALVSGNVWADRGDQYVLGKLGVMSVKTDNADALGSIGVLYGYGLTPEITVESELNLGWFGGEYKQKSAHGNYRIWTVAGYGVYRKLIGDATYLKGKLGVLYENVTRTVVENEDQVSKGFGLAGGIGAGTRIADALTFEAEITGIDKDIVFFSLGLHYAFK
ncbi:MAG: porin family protein [Gammaproteobacteria bacterium]|nr:porin family protein [Gammaproteobacteria bacterium]